MFEILSSIILWSSSGHPFPYFPRCDSKIVNGIKGSWKGNPPTDIIKKLRDDGPWAVIYASKGYFPKNVECVNMNDKSTIMVLDKDKGIKPKKLNWQESNGVLSEGTLRWYVIANEPSVLALYVCNTEGSKFSPMAAVVLSLGNIGGVPDEVKTAAFDVREQLQSLGVKIGVEYKICPL